ncbi:MAG: hypothetical protein HC927_11185 [Deltaproteobacteria bacterium]|nr:hypothetical protein [Deltaproteobacteria bacterium]
MKKLHFLAALAFLSSVTACKVEDPFDDGFDTILDTNDEAEEDTTEDNGTEVGETAEDTTTDTMGETNPTTDATDDATEEDTDCQAGTFNCPCNAGACDPGLECVDDVCQLGGNDTDTEDTTDTDGADPWDPATCMMPSQVLMVGNLEGNFCAQPCMGAMDMSCPAGPMGTFAQCALTTMQGAEPSFCALICMTAQDSCPAGSTCKDLMDPMNPGLGLCTYP